MKPILFACITAAQWMAATGLASAQHDGAYWRQSLAGGFIYEVKIGYSPGDFHNAPGWNVSYGLRPKRWLMLEAGLDQIPRPAGDSVCCEYISNAQDQLYLIPFGVRYVLEPPSSRWQFSLGGGGAYMKYTTIQGYEFIGIQGASEWGGQAVGTAAYAVTRSRRLRVGASLRWYYLPTTGFNYRFLTIGPYVSFGF